MIRMQIVERPGAELFKVLKREMRSGGLRTFSLEKQGTKVVHVSAPGHMTWTPTDGVITCQIRNRSDESKEWSLLSNFVGRLADRFPALVESINIQLTAPPPAPVKKKRRRRT